MGPSGEGRNSRDRSRFGNEVKPIVAAEPRESTDGAELMLRLAAGDSSAFAALIERYQSPVFNTVRRYLGDRAVAEEITQEVFVRVFKAAATYERKAKFETWLHHVVFNLCANAADYTKRRKALSIDRAPTGDSAPIDVVAHEDRGPMERLESVEIARIVRAAIARLPDQQRAALILSRYECLPYQEIAASLGVSLEAVKSLLFRARENLKRMLESYVREGTDDEL